MKTFSASETTLFFNTRDELVRVKLERVVFFEADSNYCHVYFANGAKATILTSLVNIENLIAERFKDASPLFIRIGKRYIVNRQFIFQINVPRQKLLLSDLVAPDIFELSVSREALKKMKQLFTGE